ncbi:MAG: TonB-dependent receptor [Chitinophagaceae bacterium]|nr:TonB-dependent receptor [Chitinophagaceae bacterium]
MRLIAFALFSLSLSLSARSVSQTISFTAKNVSLEKAFKEIRKQTDYSVFYSKELIKMSQPITLSVKDMQLVDFLVTILKHQPLDFSIEAQTVLISKKIIAAPQPAAATTANPPIDVRGRILDEQGKPVVASILVKGTNKGVTSNEDGDFVLYGVDAQATLVISATNIEGTELKISGRTQLSITVRIAMNSLNDVVVVGFGTQRRNDLTGAVSTVDKRLLENRPVTNSVAALQGAAPGLTVTRLSGQPGKEGFDTQIRGFSSVNGTNSALVLIDGVEGDLTLINPNDIESVTVLKDAAAASIYGAKAAGGVLLVTTKKGTAEKLSLTYTGLATLNRAHNIPQRIHSWEEATMLNEAWQNAGSNPPYTAEQIEWMKDPNIDYKVSPANPGRYDYYYDLNQVDMLLKKNSFSQTHNVAVRGGGDKSQYLFSLGYFGQDGIFKVGYDNTERYNARMNISTKLNNIFSLDSRLAYSQMHTFNPSDDISEDYGLFMNLYQLGSVYPIYLPGSDSTKYARTNSGPKIYQILKDGGYGEETRRNIDGLFTLKAENIVDNLSLRLIYSPQIYMRDFDSFYKTIAFYDIGPEPARYLFNPNGISKTRAMQTRTNVQALADYDFAISSRHRFHVLGGYQYQFYKLNSTTATSEALITADLPSVNLNGDPAVPSSASDDIQTNALISYFGRLNYNYNEKYFIEGTLRNDASSQLSPGNRNQFFPSLSAAWRIDNEEWFKAAFPVFNLLKIRASWGKLGNSNVLGNYDYISMLSRGPYYPFNHTRNNSLYQAVLASPDKTWETIETTNGGLDIGLLNNRFIASFDYFVRKNNNMLVALNAPAVLGLTPSASNAAKLRTWGWEAAAGWRDRISSFNYWISVNISDNQNKIVRYEGQDVITEGLNTIINGLPINSIYGYQSDGYFNSDEEVTDHAFQDSRTGPGDIRYVDKNKDDRIDGGSNRPDDHGDLIYLGNTSPRYTFGVNLGFEWAGFDFSALLQGVGKRNILIYPYVSVPFVESWRQPWKINQDYWRPDNTDALFPRLYLEGTQNTLTSTKWVQNAAYIRLKNIQIGYTIPARITRTVKIQKARIFFSGQDIWEKSKMWYEYFDAENPNNAAYNYPFFRSYAAGLNVTF